MTSIKTHQLRVNIDGVETEIIANKFAATTVVNISQTGTFGDWVFFIIISVKTSFFSH